MANTLAELELESTQVVYEHKVSEQQIKEAIATEDQPDDLQECLDNAQSKRDKVRLQLIPEEDQKFFADNSNQRKNVDT